MNKYNNKKIAYDGLIFDSKKELKRYQDLKLLEKQKIISELKVQPRFDIHLNDKYICFYKADFSYIDDSGYTIVEDVKTTGTITPTYRLKKKLVEAYHKIKINEVF